MLWRRGADMVEVRGMVSQAWCDAQLSEGGTWEAD